MTKKSKSTVQDEDLNYPDVDVSHLYKIIPNRFLLSVSISKRARQLSEGAKPLVETVPGKPFNAVAVAIKELSEGLIKVSIKEDVDDELELLEELDKGLEAKIKSESKDAKSDNKEKKPPRSKSLSTS